MKSLLYFTFFLLRQVSVFYVYGIYRSTRTYNESEIASVFELIRSWLYRYTYYIV